MICPVCVHRVSLGLVLAAGTASLVAACQADGPLRTAPNSGQLDQPVSNPGRSSGPNPGPGADPVQFDQVPGVHGQVVDDRNQPIGNAFVQVAPVGNSPAVPELAVFTDADGRFVWPLQPGRYKVSVSNDKGQAERVVDLPPKRRVNLILQLE